MDYTETLNDLQELLYFCPNPTIYYFFHSYTMLTLPHYLPVLLPVADKLAYRRLLSVLHQALDLFPRNNWLHCFYARALWAEFCFEEARQHLFTALKIDPRYPLAIELYAHTLLHLERADDALHYINRAIRAYPAVGRFYFVRAEVFAQYAMCSVDLEETRMFAFLAARDFDRASLLFPLKRKVINARLSYLHRLVALQEQRGKAS